MPTLLYALLFCLAFIENIPCVYKREMYLSDLCMILIFLPNVLNLCQHFCNDGIENAIVNLYGELQVFLNVIIGIVCIRNGTKSTSRMLAFILISYAITGLTTGLVAISNPNVSKAITADTESASYLFFPPDECR